MGLEIKLVNGGNILENRGRCTEPGHCVDMLSIPIASTALKLA